MATKRDYYDVLDVSRSASDDEIKNSFFKLVKKYHPDVKGTGDQEKFKEIAEAYETLSDPDKRKTYDQYGHDSEKFAQMGGGEFDFESFTQRFGHDFGDIFSGISDIFNFGGFGSTFGRQSSNRDMWKRSVDGADKKINFEIEEEAVGEEVKAKVDIDSRCYSCGGMGAVNPSQNIAGCSYCHGTGHQVRQRRIMGGIFQQMQVNCDECGGTGVKIKKKCKECKGQGIITSPEYFAIKVPHGACEATFRFRGKGYAGRNQGEDGDLFISVSVR